MRALRAEVGGIVGQLAACASCTRGYRAPEGIWDGGHCCSGSTVDLFRDHEVAALHLGGTRARHLRAPRTRPAGCAFRGPTGCALPVEHRPNVCVRYLCAAARRELHERGDLLRTMELIASLEELFEEFTEQRAARQAEEELRTLQERS